MAEMQLIHQWVSELIEQGQSYPDFLDPSFGALRSEMSRDSIFPTSKFCAVVSKIQNLR